MCSDLFTNSLNYFTNYIKSHKFNANEQSSRIKTPSKQTKLNVFSFIYKLFKLFTNYSKSHKFNTNERPHEQSSRIKLPSTLPVFLITVQLNEQLDVPYLLPTYDSRGKRVSSKTWHDQDCLHPFVKNVQ